MVNVDDPVRRVLSYAENHRRMCGNIVRCMHRQYNRCAYIQMARQMQRGGDDIWMKISVRLKPLQEIRSR